MFPPAGIWQNKKPCAWVVRRGAAVAVITNKEGIGEKKLLVHETGLLQKRSVFFDI